jgi:hypothetical protein
MKTIDTFIQNILFEVCLDKRIENSTIDISNPIHIEIIADHLYERKMGAQIVMEVVNGLVLRDGKFPDRQAYNKDGWLVTFPSADYKNAAIQKGTHYSSDPTHGKGGMNLYYKKKGKQSRPAQQSTSVTDTGEDEQSAQDSSSPAPQEPSQQPDSQEKEAPIQTTSTKQSQSSTDSSLPQSDDAGEKSPQENPKTEPVNKSANSGNNADTSVDKPNPSSDQPELSKQLEAPPAPSIIELSKKFARDHKNWGETPYGDWHDDVGEKVAVTALDGQVVPVNYADRESLKTFIKNTTKT